MHISRRTNNITYGRSGQRLKLSDFDTYTNAAAMSFDSTAPGNLLQQQMKKNTGITRNTMNQMLQFYELRQGYYYKVRTQ